MKIEADHNREEAEERIIKLRDLINDYRYRYHVLDESTMTEAAADSLKHELSLLEEEYPDLVTPDSPTQRVAGAPLEKFKRAKHSSRMLSLNDVFDESELLAWQTRISKLVDDPSSFGYFTDIKMDGLACALVYEEGSLVKAITRGDGFEGEDVTVNVKTMQSVPLSLRRTTDNEIFLRGRTEVRGEIVLYKKDFDALNEKREKAGLPLFANPRNTAAGTIRQLDSSLVAERPLKFHAYDLIRDSLSEVATHDFAYKTLKSLGFLANADAKVNYSVIEVMEYADLWESKRRDLPFDTDGLVIKINDRGVYERLGVVGKAPRAAVAYKYPAEQSTTVVKDIFLSIGRTGAATPVAMLEPVLVAGSTVQMATLHNEGEILRKDIRVGDTVIIHKAGDIIPEVVESLKTLRTGSEQAFKMPKNCPECDAALTKTKLEDAVWRCPNSSCPARSQRHIEHFASKGALDIEGMGEKNVIALLESGLISDQADIYNLKVEQLLELDRFAEVSANKLLQAIQAKKNPALARFLFGLGIRHVGVQTAIDLADHFESLANIAEATIDDLASVDGVGDVVAEAVVAWFSDVANQRLLQKFTEYGVIVQDAVKASGSLQGKKFVVTGTLPTMGRAQVAERIRLQGGVFQNSLGKDTDYLVVGASVGASKLAKAEKLGTKQISEDDLLTLLTSTQ